MRNENCFRFFFALCFSHSLFASCLLLFFVFVFKVDSPSVARGCNIFWGLIRLGSLLLFALIILVLFVLLVIPHSPIRPAVIKSLEFVKGYGPWGAVVFASTYVVGVTLLIPGTPFNLAAGYLYGVWLGSIAAWIGITVGSVLAFMMGRIWFRGWAHRLARSRRWFWALDHAIARYGAFLLFLTRLSPIMVGVISTLPSLSSPPPLLLLET